MNPSFPASTGIIGLQLVGQVKYSLALRKWPRFLLLIIQFLVVQYIVYIRGTKYKPPKYRP